MLTPTIISILKQDHREVSALLEEATESSERASSKRKTLFDKIRKALAKHMAFEEKHLYPALVTQKPSKDDALEAVEEHGQVKFLLQDIADTDPSDERWKAKVTVLAEDIKHHVKEEESFGGIFSQVKKALDQQQLVELGELYQESK
jgi:hemerythrin superfamily protein